MLFVSRNIRRSILQKKKHKYTVECVDSGDESDWKERSEKKNWEREKKTLAERKVLISRWINKEKSERGGERRSFGRKKEQNKIYWHAREITPVWLGGKHRSRFAGRRLTSPSRVIIPRHIFLNRTHGFVALLTSDASWSSRRMSLTRRGWPFAKHCC